MQLYGIDFTSAPSRRKAITIAGGHLEGELLVLDQLISLHDFPSFESWLQRPGPWLGAFDFPFSLPRELVVHLGWPLEWPALIRHLRSHTRQELRTLFKAFCDSREPGNKFAHRATDLPAGSSSPMKWVNPPVAYMLHAGAPRLLEAGVSVHGLHAGDPQRIALEGYPGLVARSITRQSYKNDDPRKQSEERRRARMLILDAVTDGAYPLAVKLDVGAHRSALVDDPGADLLDAVLCLLAAAWSWQRRGQNFGTPACDPLEGWIAGA
ncbi:DUF429 domain-containing protein [Lacisediminimonas profundi]|uniref:DUF429 domain-containing protein n=1 Tax=Lacisediminimonas profundi TaxID=2603856 RepID=UPI00124B5EC8|nr:DUF429 domain-containing protein [Lacisediminimonas profundi]